MVLRYPYGSGSRLSRRLLGRGLLIAIHGAAGALIALGVHHISRGMVAAGAFMLALFLSAATVGCLIATAIERREDNWHRSVRKRSGAATCHSCGQPMQERQSIMACPQCDRIFLDR